MTASQASKSAGVFHPFRRAIFRGLAVVLPPLLTVLVFLWAWGMIETYILTPAERATARAIMWSIRDVKSGVPQGAVPYPSQGPITSFEYGNKEYVQVNASGKWIPKSVKLMVDANPSENAPAPVTANGYFERYIHLQFLKRSQTVPLFLALFVLVLYLTGKFMAAGLGHYMRRKGEAVVDRMPVVRDVYSAAKQITDSIFSEQEIQFLRVVAVEYPRKGLWQIAFVTSDGFKDIHDVAGEPIVSLLMSHSPVPATGFTCIALKRDTIDLNISVDQALQFIVSCGVVVPPHQQWNSLSQRELGDDITRHVLQTTDQAERLIKSA